MIADASLFIAGEHNEWNGAGFHCPELWYRQLPGRKYFQQHCLKSIVYFVQLINEKHARPFALESTHERTWAKEVAPLQTRLYGLPVLVVALGELHIETL